MSVLFGLGSNNPAAVPLSLSSFFIFAALAALAARRGPGQAFRLAGLALTGAVVVAAITLRSWSQPYRQPAPLGLASVPVAVPLGGGSLRLAEPQAQFLESVYEIARRAGFQPMTPVVDLTGRLPGLVYAMRGSLPGAAWLGSGHPGSRQAAVMVLNRLSCLQLSAAWVVAAESPLPYHFDPGVLAEAGIDPESHYQLVGTARLLIEVGPRELAYQELLFLKPLPDWPAKVHSCLARRQGGRGAGEEPV
jgi:uncharacterized SAM-binding protein YcdF (DUF218 family)